MDDPVQLELRASAGATFKGNCVLRMTMRLNNFCFQS